MLVLAVILTFLVALSTALGLMILNLTGCRDLRSGDLLLLAGWTGFLSLSLLNLGVSLVTPLTPTVLIAECVLVAGCLCIAPTMRGQCQTMLSTCRATSVPVLAVLILIVSAMGAQWSVNRDGLSYQFDLIHYLSETGAAPGLALVHSRYGFISSWFTVPALFNHGFLYARVAMLSNLLFTTLAFLHMAVATRRLLRADARISDCFLAPALFAAMSLPTLIHMPVSPSPDVPVVLTTVLVAWAMLLREQTPKAIPAHLPLLLATLALTIKLSALPVVAVAGLYFLWSRPSPRTVMRVGVGTMAIVLPLLLAGILVSGHWLYPLPFMAPVSWAIGHEWALVDSLLVENYARWGSGTLPPEAAQIPYLSVAWLKQWVRLDLSNGLGFAGFLISLFCLPFWTRLPREQRRMLCWPVFVGLVGILFLLAKAPAPRFGWAYLTIIPATLLGGFLFTHRIRIPRVDGRVGLLLALTLPVILFAGNVLFKTTSEKRIQQAIDDGVLPSNRAYGWLQPPVMPLVSYSERRNAAVALTDHANANDLFARFDRPLYFSWQEREDIMPRRADQHPRGGFRRTDAWQAPNPAEYE